MAKYINSPESNVYKKSNELYGIYQARADIVREDKCYLVEGYLDVIGMWQSGMRNTVASSGTALTDGQIALIHRFTENITLIYDGDAAGIKASLRGIDMLLNHKMKVKVLLLPDGDDPDSFARKHTSEEFRKYVAEHETDIIRFKAQVLLADIKKDPQKRIEAVNSVVQSIAHIADPVSRDVYIQECASILGIQEDTIAKSVARVRGTLVEKWKQDRIKREFPITSESAQTANPAHPSGNGGNMPAGISENTQPLKPLSKIAYSSPMLPLEKVVIEYCLKYGFLELCTIVNDDNSETSVSVLDFVSEELEADNQSFSVNIFDRIFRLLKDMKEEYAVAYEHFSQKLDESLDRQRKEGIEKIAASDLSVIEIERAEKKLENELESKRAEDLIEFSKDYPGRQLASHEDGEVRYVVTELIRERHQLSHIYMRDNNYVERDEDRLSQLVPRAMTEWKNELLNLRLKELFSRFHEISGKGDTEEENKLMMEMNAIMRLRSQVAKDIGDRILSPRSKTIR